MLKAILGFIARVKEEVCTNSTERIREAYQRKIDYADAQLERCIQMQKFAEECAARPGISPASYSNLMQTITELKSSEEQYRASLLQARIDLEHQLKLEAIVSMPLTGCPRAAMARHLNRP